MMQYDVIENNGVLAPSRREAIIDPLVGANHNNNKPATSKAIKRVKLWEDQCEIKRAKFGEDQHENVTVFDTKYVSIFFLLANLNGFYLYFLQG